MVFISNYVSRISFDGQGDGRRRITVRLENKASSLLGLLPSVMMENDVSIDDVVDLYDDDLPSPELIEEEVFRWKGRSVMYLISRPS